MIRSLGGLTWRALIGSGWSLSVVCVCVCVFPLQFCFLCVGRTLPVIVRSELCWYIVCVEPRVSPLNNEEE